MKVCLFVLIICITFLSSKAEDANPGSDMHIHPLVVNGNDADQHEWPWQVRLKRSGTFICGGSLISDNWVLTAAHCVDTNPNPAYYTVEVGAHWMSRSTAVQKSLAVTYLWYHKAFSRSHLRNDIALLLLNETVNITSKIRPIKLPRQGNRINAGRTCYITGWGRLRGYGSLPTVLQEAPLKIGSDSDCAQKNGNTFQASSMICAGSEGKGGCNGDSGGPLSCYEGGQWILRGVVSWGKVGCPTSYYTVFARVSSFVSWISRVKGQEGNINCNFDDSSSLCQFSWKQDRFDDFDWTRNRGSTNYHGTGPSADHTKGTYYGYYMYTYTTYRKSGDKARLYSSPVNATNKCFSFWYHMHGRDIGALNVLVKAGQQNETLWSKKGPSGNRWLQGKINLRNQGKISIIFEAISGSGKEGHIAIDDVALTNGSCSISQSCRDQTCYNKGNAYCLNNTGYCYCQSGSYGQQCEFLSYNCSFDGGLCSLWDQDTTDVTDWTRYQGFTPDFGTGPSRDHTTGSGSFFYLETSNKRFGDTARLISKVLPATNNTCFTFWYHMYGKDINTLRILLKKAGQQTVVWSRKIQTGRNQWFEGKATLNSDEPFQVVIEGVVGNGYLGDIGIDDVSIVNETCSISKSCRDQTCYNDGHAYCLNNTGHCYCPDDSIGQQCERYRCDFNKDLCDDLWHQERTTDRFDWTRNQGPTNVANTGPSADHINKVDHVSHQTYITVKTSCTYTTINKYNGRFTSPNYPSYYKNRESCYWLLTSNGRISISFESFYTESCCDKVYVYDGGSSSSRLLGQYSGTKIPPKLTSSFKQLYVRFTSDGSVTYRGFSVRYGPPGYLQASGYYIYINTDSNRRFGDTARFASKFLPATSGTCLSFWYHMYGSDINALNVILKSNQRNTTVWSRKGESGNRWLEGKVTISTNDTYKIAFEGVAGSGIEGHIALDDISLSKGACNISRSCQDQICYNDGNPYCLNNTGYCYCSSDTYGDKCQFVNYNCSFDKGICRHLWTQDSKNDQLDWNRQRGPSWPYTTGPSRDHTSGNGYYMTIRSRYQRKGNAAHLISRQLPSTNQSCLAFWYHMYGTNIGTLRIVRKNGNENVTIWSRNGQSGNRWLQGKVDLESHHEFQLIFEGVVGGYYGDIALDDVSLINETCSIPDSCRDHFCHNDGHAYCMNNTGYCYCSHENIGKYCEKYRCTFDQDYCQNRWYQDRTDNFDWYRRSYSAGVSNTGPSSDHTTGRGYYLYIYTYYRRLGDTARFVSKTLPATNSTCLSFWYHMYGYDINTLKVIVKTIRDFTIVWSRKGRKGDRWLEGKVNILTNESYQIIFEGVAGSSMFGEIALDDISIIKGICTTSTPEPATTEPPTPEPATTEPPTPAQRSHTQNPEPATNQTKNQGIRCAKLNCFNGGSRVCTSDSQAMCICPRGITGRQCQHKDTWCAEIECFNGGTRVCTSGGQAMCICPRGFKGHQCLSKETIPEKRTAQAIDAQEQQKYKTGKTLNYVSIVVIVALIGVIIALVLRNQHLKNRIINCYSKVKRYFNGTPSDIAVQSTSAYQAFHCENPMSDIPISAHSSEYQSANHLQRQDPSTHHQQQGVTFKELTPKDLQSGNSTHQSLGNDASDPTYQQVVFHGNPTQTESQI